MSCIFAADFMKGSADYLSACGHLPAAPTAQVDAQAGADFAEDNSKVKEGIWG